MVLLNPMVEKMRMVQLSQKEMGVGGLGVLPFDRTKRRAKRNGSVSFGRIIFQPSGGGNTSSCIGNSMFGLTKEFRKEFDFCFQGRWRVNIFMSFDLFILVGAGDKVTFRDNGRGIPAFSNPENTMPKNFFFFFLLLLGCGHFFVLLLCFVVVDSFSSPIRQINETLRGYNREEEKGRG